MIPVAWLDACTMAEAETQGFEGPARQWEALKGKAQEGDRFWRFVSLLEPWKALAGPMGIVLVRNGAVVDSMVTL